LLEGFAFIRVRNIILVLLLTDCAAMLFGSYTVLLPMIADHFNAGAAGYGVLASGPAVGGLMGATVIMSLGDFPYKGRLIVGCILAYSVFLVVLALAPTFPVAFVAATALGMADTMQAAPRNAVIQLLSPDELRGRVSSFQSMLAAGVPGLGQGAMGAAAGALTAPVALIGGAILCAACIVAMLVRRSDLRARDLGAAQFSAPVATSGGVASG
jgi:hypothetical protein